MTTKTLMAKYPVFSLHINKEETTFTKVDDIV